MRFHLHRVGILPTIAAVLFLALASYFSIHAAWADYQFGQDTIATSENAIALAPDNSEYYARLAWQLSEDSPQESERALANAVILNPWDAGSLIELGLRAEVRGDLPDAEQFLLNAAEMDRKFLPRWTLANYYLRHQNDAQFWVWIKQAAAMHYGDAEPLFRLCARVEQNGQLLTRLDLHDPNDCAAYLAYLLAENRVDLIEAALAHILKQSREADVPLLLTACDRLLAARRPDQASNLWARLVKAHLVPFTTTRDQLLTNAEFNIPPWSLGFDWRLPVFEGVSVAQEEPSGFRATFSGREPNESEPVAQLILLEPEVEYRFRFSYRSRGIAVGAGLFWRLTNADNAAVLIDGPDLSSEDAVERTIRFRCPRNCRLVRIALRYQRMPGTVRAEGFVAITNMNVSPANQSPTDGVLVKK